jgi:5-methylthioribose kinase
LLNERSVVPYLRHRGILNSDATVEILGGGVSCGVFGIHNQEVDFVLKQALPELKSPMTWPADRRRSLIEARAMKILYSITPKNVPQLVDVDPEEFTLTMTRFPQEFLVWKTELLKGNIRPEIGSELGRILASWHNFGFENESIRNRFLEENLFEQLRVWPFYRVMQERNPQFAYLIDGMIEEVTREKITIVHGDFSPKNILVAARQEPIVLDFEVINTGNPVFDLAFLLGHLVCKLVRTDSIEEKELIKRTAGEFLAAYSKHSKIEVAPNLKDHAALIALARVDGVSLVNYLDSSKQERVRSITRQILASPSAELMELFI